MQCVMMVIMATVITITAAMMINNYVLRFMRERERECVVFCVGECVCV